MTTNSGMENSYAILLIAGIVLFITLIGNLWKGKLTGKAATPLFLVAVIMIGYSSIKSITFGEDGLTIEKYAQAVVDDPQDQAKVNALNNALSNSNTVHQVQNYPRALSLTVHALSAVASSKAVGNDVPAARNYIAQAKALDPNSTDVKFVQEHLATIQTPRGVYQRTVAITALKTKYGLK